MPLGHMLSSTFIKLYLLLNCVKKGIKIKINVIYSIH
jgi:hypothetical protein